MVHMCSGILLAVNKNGLLLYTRIEMNLKCMMLKGKKPDAKGYNRMIHFYDIPEEANLKVTESR